MGRIFNGTVLDSRDLPFVVSIFGLKMKTILKYDLSKDAKLYCTGAIISPGFVLT